MLDFSLSVVNLNRFFYLNNFLIRLIEASQAIFLSVKLGSFLT